MSSVCPLCLAIMKLDTIRFVLYTHYHKQIS